MASSSAWARNCCRCAGAAMTAPIFASTRSIRCRATSGPSRRMASRRRCRRAAPARQRAEVLERDRQHRGRGDQGAHQGAWIARSVAACRSADPAQWRRREIRHRSHRGFRRISGRDQPGAYLVGLRAVDDDKRHWLRVAGHRSVAVAPSKSRRACASPSRRSPARSPSAARKCASKGVKDDKFVTLAQRNDRRLGLLLLERPASAAAAELRRIVVDKGSRHARRRSRPARHRNIRKENLVEAGVGMARLDERSGAAARRKAAHALPSLLGAARSIGPRSPCISRASCAAIAAAR